MITVYYGRAEQLVQKIGFDRCLNHLEERRKEKVLRTGDQISQVRSLATGELLHLAAWRYLRLTGALWEKSPEGSGERIGKGIAGRTAGVFSEDFKEMYAEGSADHTAKVFETEVLTGGKPYFKDYPQVYFNLSHSADYVCCAIGNAPVGVDIQKHVPIKNGLAKRFFTEDENRLLNSLDAEEREILFFRMWSIKESYIKFTGGGIKQGLDTFRIDWQNGCIFDKGGSRECKAADDRGAQAGGQMSGAADGAKAYFEELQAIKGYSLSVCRQRLKTEIIWCNIEEEL